MTKITRTIKVNASPENVWPFMDLRKWKDFSQIFAEVDCTAPDFNIGQQAKITAGPGAEKITYTATITALEAAKKLAYRRSGGPLPGISEWEISKNDSLCEISYNNTFTHELPQPVQKSMTTVMDNFLQDIKNAVEAE